MKKIIDYNTLSSGGAVNVYDALIKLEELVTTALKDGWEPIGGTTSVYFQGNYCFLQAMVMYKDVEQDHDIKAANPLVDVIAQLKERRNELLSTGARILYISAYEIVIENLERKLLETNSHESTS